MKCTLVQALGLCKGRTVHRGSRGIALHFLRPRYWKGVSGQLHAPAALYPGKEPVPILQEVVWAPGPVWKGAENFGPRGDRGTAVAQWLRCCATNRKVAGSIPDGVIGIFHSHNPSDRTMALGSTQPLTEMSIRNNSWG